jgi:hypothetical protein
MRIERCEASALSILGCSILIDAEIPSALPQLQKAMVCVSGYCASFAALSAAP